MNRLDMLRALGADPKAEAAIFWFCYAWHTGKDSDLYRIMRESPYTPPMYQKFDEDPDIVRMFGALERAFPGQIEIAYQPVRLDELRAGDVIIAGKNFLCMRNRWPCRIVEWEGNLAVACDEGMHRLRADDKGFVIGFRR